MKEKIKKSAYPKGSEWRRWDLHVHTPESKLGSSFPGVVWDDYLHQLESRAQASGIAVIGVTDYMTIDGYEKLYGEKNNLIESKLESIHLLIPNIEFRVLPSTSDGKALNIHLLVDPSDKDHIQKIKRALKNLKTSYNGESYGCIREELIEFAKAHDPSITDEDVAYKSGISQFKPSYTELSKWIEAEKWLRENSLIGVSNGKDGISGLPASGFSAIRDELLRKSHFVFSGLPNDREYYLGKKTGTNADDIRRMYGGLKPCLHGSDAHAIEKLFVPDLNRYCWIKGDPTFEGLRQVLWEPESRVYIGETSPQLSDMSRIISSMRINNHNDWFGQDQIDFNSGLVAIIGEKGAGKTAIADLVSFGAGIAPDPESQSSFIVKGNPFLKGAVVELTWGTSQITCGTLTDKPHDSHDGLVRYLSQDFVERLCSVDHGGNELQKAIEDVVFSHLDQVQQEGFSSFEALRSSREEASQYKKDECRGNLASVNREIERLHNAIAQRPTKVGQKEQFKKQLEETQKQLPGLTSTEDNTILEKLKSEEESLKAIELAISIKTKQKRKLDEQLGQYTQVKDRTTGQIEDIISELEGVEGVDSGLLARFKPQWDSSLELDASKISEKIQSEIAVLRGNPEVVQDSGNSREDIIARIKKLQDSLTNDENKKKRLLDLQKQIQSTEIAISRLDKEIDEIDKKYTKQLEQKEKERLNHYLEYFSVLLEDKHGLQQLYAPMQTALENIEADMKFELSAGYRIDLNNWLEKSFRFYDNRKVLSSGKRDLIETVVYEKLHPAWLSGNVEKIKEALIEFVTKVAPTDFIEKCASPSITLIDLFDWMFSTDHISTTYKIQYGGTPLEYLSPGTRGIALLVLYLLMDEDDRRPLIIDQPEGNLDNSSIYQQLVPYIRKAKEKRQIILVTHNPNLVVSTDAEQIVIALPERLSGQSHPKITYIAGSIEHSIQETDSMGIRQAVCTLLEGGDRAFKEREGRYSIKD
jgi:hypothetical protein